MAQIVLKWPIPLDGERTIPWLDDAKVTGVQVRASGDTVDVWIWYADHVAMAEAQRRRFTIVGTGHHFDDGWEIVGTTQHPTLALVWHLAAGPVT